MGKGGQLKGSKIYMNHDLSREDINMQRKLREIARKEREQRAEVRLRFRKIRINGNKEGETMVFYREVEEISK